MNKQISRGLSNERCESYLSYYLKFSIRLLFFASPLGQGVDLAYSLWPEGDWNTGHLRCLFAPPSPVL